MMPKEIADLFAELELHLIDSLKRNLMRHRRQEIEEGGTGNVPQHWEAWQSAKLRDIRRFRRENERILGEYTPTIHAETEKLLREQCAEGGSDGFFHTSDDRLRSLIHEMQHNEARAERAALRYMNDVYRKTVLRTVTAMTAGGMTLQKATDEATKDFLAQGINCVQYSNGRCVNIASYAEMALRTCSTRAMLMGEAKQRDRLGIDTVLVSQYGACSDTCLPWQGRVYIDDVFQEYHGTRGGSFGISRNGRQYMFLSVAIRGGLFHPNCRHTISNWIEGVSTMPEPMDAAQIEKVNKLEARQRALERAVRRAKREEAGLTDPEARKAARNRRRAAQAAVREFVNEYSDVLRRDYWRERDAKIPSDWGTVQNNLENRESLAYNRLQKVHYSGDTSPEDEKAFEEALSRMPLRHREIAESEIEEIVLTDSDVGSYYSRKQKKIYLSRHSNPDVAIHEYAHAMADALSVYDDPAYNAVLKKGFEDIGPMDVIYDEETFVEPVYRVEHPKLISVYQGRLYEEVGIFDGTEVSLRGMLDYFSEGYEEYIRNPENLKRHDPELFEYFEAIT